MKRIASALFLLCAFAARAAEVADPCRPPTFPSPEFNAANFNVRDFGAVADGRANDTGAINRAIEKCNSVGGGDVVFPAGKYAAASIHLKSNIRFLLDKDAVITGAPSGYDPPEPNEFEKYQDFGHSHFRNALMWGENIENFAIIGGRVNGGYIVEGDPKGRDIGDKVISITRSRNLLFQNVTHETGGHFVYLLNDCENVHIDRVRVKKSRDAVNFVGCRNVQLHGCNFTGCGDDTIALKSDWALGRKILSENIYVWDSYLETSCNALQFGAETTGDFRNVNFWNIRIGRAMKAAIGITSANGGLIDGVNYRDITIKGAACPIFIHVINQRRSSDPNQKIGAIKNVKISNVSITDCRPTKGGLLRTSAILGHPGSYLENIMLEQVKMVSKGGGKYATAWDLKDEPRKVAKKALPAAGLYIRHAKGVTLENVELALESPDSRPPLVVYDAIGLTLNNFKSQKTASGMLRLEKVENLSVLNSQGLPERRSENLQTLTE
ncbi:MAG: glycosyl hydrolase family 28 protein [Verrucomicrobiota bacterium]|nr:glycosyl hydrolase family 28 protein [Verrucomicrobiota bacterium]